MSDAISTTMAEQTHAIQTLLMAKTQQELQGAIAMQLIQSAVMPQTDWQDPSEITPQQLQSPIDIKV